MNHDLIDMRSLELAKAVVDRIDADPNHGGLERARQVCRRWLEQGSGSAVEEWASILERPWQEIRAILLDPSEEGRRRRQSNPFCGILSPQERWEIYQRFRAREYKGGSNSPFSNKRVAGIHQGLVQISDDFDEDLPEAFWTGK